MRSLLMIRIAFLVALVAWLPASLLAAEDPAKYAPVFVEAGAARISFHPEVVADAAEVIGVIRAAGAGVGIAVHPDVGLDQAKAHLGDLDVVLMMTVRPGFGGQKFLEQVVPKIEQAREMVDRAGASADIEVDGGVNLSTVDAAVGAGGEYSWRAARCFDGVDRRPREAYEGKARHVGADREGATSSSSPTTTRTSSGSSRSTSGSRVSRSPRGPTASAPSRGVRLLRTSCCSTS